MYKETYSDSHYSNLWDSIFVSCELFRILSLGVAEHFNFTYPINDDKNMTKYLKTVSRLSSSAKKIY